MKTKDVVTTKTRNNTKKSIVSPTSSSRRRPKRTISRSSRRRRRSRSKGKIVSLSTTTIQKNQEKEDDGNDIPSKTQKIPNDVEDNDTTTSTTTSTSSYFHCYLLRSQDVKHPYKTYVGYTTNPYRRMKQHNGIVKGGANRTQRAGRPWTYVAIVEGFPNNIVALQFEWAWHHCDRSLAVRKIIGDIHAKNLKRKQRGVIGQLCILKTLVEQCGDLYQHVPLTIYFLEEAFLTLYEKESLLPSLTSTDEEATTATTTTESNTATTNVQLKVIPSVEVMPFYAVRNNKLKPSKHKKKESSNGSTTTTTTRPQSPTLKSSAKQTTTSQEDDSNAGTAANQGKYLSKRFGVPLNDGGFLTFSSDEDDDDDDNKLIQKYLLSTTNKSTFRSITFREIDGVTNLLSSDHEEEEEMSWLTSSVKELSVDGSLFKHHGTEGLLYTRNNSMLELDCNSQDEDNYYWSCDSLGLGQPQLLPAIHHSSMPIVPRTTTTPVIIPEQQKQQDEVIICIDDDSSSDDDDRLSCDSLLGQKHQLPAIHHSSMPFVPRTTNTPLIIPQQQEQDEVIVCIDDDSSSDDDDDFDHNNPATCNSKKLSSCLSPDAEIVCDESRMDNDDIKSNSISRSVNGDPNDQHKYDTQRVCRRICTDSDSEEDDDDDLSAWIATREAERKGTKPIDLVDLCSP